MKPFRSYSSAETKQFGVDLGKRVAGMGSTDGIGHKHGALVVALQGDLGAGKTTFTQGFARGLGIRRRTASPTFIIMRRFAIPITRKTKAKSHFKNLYHIDAYRLKQLDSLEPLGLKEIFADPAAIVLIEWPEKIKKILPKKIMWLKFQHGKKENERIITI
jgi:tRNA threonylcarbamoyladenosine biosynthesis protein TsaE